MVQALIKVEQVSKRFGDKTVLQNISFSVDEGETLAIIGTSGCGKSTLLKIIAGLLEPTSGQVHLNDPNFTLVFQYSALFDSLSVYENVGFSLLEPPDDPAQRKAFKALPEAEVRRQVREKLELLGLGDIEDRLPSELSGGMQKRVSFARAMMSQPRIILYDEPTAGLDPVASATIEDAINTLSQTLCAASIVVTHTLSTVCRTAQRVIVLHEGRLHWEGTPQELLTTEDPIAQHFRPNTQFEPPAQARC